MALDVVEHTARNAMAIIQNAQAGDASRSQAVQTDGHQKNDYLSVMSALKLAESI